jgi:hypothetical protein
MPHSANLHHRPNQSYEMKNLMDILSFMDTASRVATRATAKSRAFKLECSKKWEVRPARETRRQPRANCAPGSHPEQLAAAYDQQ